MTTLRDSITEAERELIGYASFTAGILTINAAGAATFKSTNAYIYTVDGVFKSKAALAAQAFSAGHAAQAVGVTQYYVVGLDALGNVTTYQGAEETFIQLGVPTTVPTYPDVPNGITPIGIIKVVATAVPFVPGTTPLDTVGLTVSYFDVSVIPSVLV
jgi:hypothetical protein